MATINVALGKKRPSFARRVAGFMGVAMACSGAVSHEARADGFDYQLNVVGSVPLTSMIFITPKGGKPVLAKPTDWWNPDKVLDHESLVFRLGNRELRNAASWGFPGMPNRADNFSRRITSERCAQDGPANAHQRKGWAKLSELAQSGPNFPGVAWFNNYASNANDQILFPPWHSAFPQALNLQSLLTGYCLDKNPAYLDLAMKAGDNLIAPIEKGGLTNPLDDGSVWFEELPGAKGLMPFILNGHLYAMNALYLLAEASGQQKYRDAAEAGRKALDRLLLDFDIGYWTRYDLRPRYFDMYFEMKIPDGAEIKRVDFTWNAGATESKFTICEEGCDRTIAYVKNLDFLKISAFLEGARIYNPGDGLRVSIEYTGTEVPKFYATGYRPDRREMYEVTLKKTGETTVQGDLGVRDSGWHAPDIGYMEYHAALMADLYAWTKKPTYYVTALRWRNYLDDWKGGTVIDYRPRVFDLTASEEADARLYDCVKAHNPIKTPLNVLNDAVRACVKADTSLLGRVGLRN